MPADFDRYLRGQIDQLAGEVDTSGVIEEVHRRVRRRLVRRRAQVAALSLVVLAGTGVGTYGFWRVFSAAQPVAGPSPAITTVPAPRVQTVASVVLRNELRAVLTATRAADGRATVQVAVEQQAGGAWRRVDQHVIGDRDGWSWTTVSAPASICQLSAADASPPRFDVSLLAGPSGRCSPVYRFRLQDGRLLPG